MRMPPFRHPDRREKRARLLSDEFVRVSRDRNRRSGRGRDPGLYHLFRIPAHVVVTRGETIDQSVLSYFRGAKALKNTWLLLAAVLSVASLFSCGERREANRKTDSDVQGMVLATVNGVPITEHDMRQVLRRVPHGEKPSPEPTKELLETLVRSELIYQQGVELGLDKNPQYRARLSEVEAQLRAFQRQEMSALYREYVRSKAAVTDSEAQEYFTKNTKRIQTRFHVWQIYYRGEEARIAQAHRDIKSGIPFEKVAAERFPKLPKGMQAPWDLGYLHWSQIPVPWQAAVDRLEPGQASDIIRGPNERFWVIKLVDRMVDPTITFAAEKEKIVELLRKQKADELHDSMLSQMRTRSKIIFK